MLLASESWIVQNLQSTFEVWTRLESLRDSKSGLRPDRPGQIEDLSGVPAKMAEIWSLLSQSPSQFKGGAVWSVIRNINSALVATGLALLVLFFAMGVMKSTIDIAQLKRPEQAVKFFLRFILAKMAVTYGLEIITTIFEICQGVVTSAMSAVSGLGAQAVSIPAEIVKKIEEVGFFESIPLWAVTLLGSLFVTVLAFVMILSIYGRFFRMFTYAAIAPVPLSTFAGEGTSSIGVHFLKSFAGGRLESPQGIPSRPIGRPPRHNPRDWDAAPCLEGVVVVIACLIYSAFVSSNPVTVKADMSAVNLVWAYVGETIFGMLVLVGSIKASDRVIKELMGL